jgi:hypothetical protein
MVLRCIDMEKCTLLISKLHYRYAGMNRHRIEGATIVSQTTYRYNELVFMFFLAG